MILSAYDGWIGCEMNGGSIMINARNVLYDIFEALMRDAIREPRQWIGRADPHKMYREEILVF